MAFSWFSRNKTLLVDISSIKEMKSNDSMAEGRPRLAILAAREGTTQPLLTPEQLLNQT